MLMAILGLVDLLAGVELILLKWGLFVNIAWILIVILVLKSLIFIRSLASILDLISAGVMLMIIFSYDFSLSFLFGIWLIQKGFFSFKNIF